VSKLTHPLFFVDIWDIFHFFETRQVTYLLNLICSCNLEPQPTKGHEKMVAEVIALAPALYLLMVATPIITTDIKEQRIPNAFVLPAYPITLVSLLTASVISGRWLAFWFSLGLFVVGFALLMTLNAIRSLGMGDVKLISVMVWGMSWFTLWNGLLLLFAPLVLAFLFALILILFKKAYLLRTLRIPLAPFIYVPYALSLALTLIY
jgi:leader peptidase (prepilin peptidase)/N-methyltransferase